MNVALNIQSQIKFVFEIVTAAIGGHTKYVLPKIRPECAGNLKLTLLWHGRHAAVTMTSTFLTSWLGGVASEEIATDSAEVQRSRLKM
jgi:hypothetical protein